MLHTITTSLPKSLHSIHRPFQLESWQDGVKKKQEMSEVKKTDHSADVLASIKSQVPTVVDKYLGTKLDNALLKVLERHTADLIEKHSVLTGLESIQNQESEKSPKEIIRTKREQDAMDKEVADKVKDHKRKHDSDNDEDTDDDEGPSAGSNQGKSAKRRRHDSGASRSAQPPTKDNEQSSKKPRKSDPESEQSEQSSDNIPMQDEGHVSDLEDTDNAYIPKVSTTMWFKPIPEGERPATPEPEWTIPPNDFSEPENNWANTYATTYQVHHENKLHKGRTEHFDRDDNTGDDNEETKPDPEEIYNHRRLHLMKPVSPPLQESFITTFTTNIRTTPAEQFSSEMVKSRLRQILQGPCDLL
ncbi:hypothetical protein Tco_0452324 [Tanacetum coccineum]